jgi:hypothetical protein
VALRQDTQPGVDRTGGGEPLDQFTVDSRREPGAPRLDRGSKVEQLVAPEGGEADDPTVPILDDLHLRVRIGDLRLPPGLDLRAWERVGLLREDVCERLQRTRLLNIHQRGQVMR